MNIFGTYDAPAKKRQIIKMGVLIENAEIKEKMNPPKAAIRITFCRPHVSAKYPQKYEVVMVPRNDIEPKIPCPLVVKFRSHLMYGKTTLILTFSMAAPISAIPVKMIKNIWNLPYSWIENKWFEWKLAKPQS